MKFFSAKKTSKKSVRKTATIPVDNAFNVVVSPAQKNAANRILGNGEASKWGLV